MRSPEIYSFGANALRLCWPFDIDQQEADMIQEANEYVKNKFSNYMLETVPTYSEIAVYLKSDVAPDEVIELLKKVNWSFSTREEGKVTHIIPVCYDQQYAPDMAELMQHTGLSRSEVIALHTKPRYSVRFLGFLPGFPYLSGLDPRLATPRKSSPKTRVVSGSVGVGGKQTGVYTMDSPGGWMIIGRTPIRFFSVERKRPVFMKPGDWIEFQAVTADAFAEIEQRMIGGEFNIEKREND